MSIVFNLPQDVNVLNIIPHQLIIENPMGIIPLIQRTNQAMQNALNTHRITHTTCLKPQNH